MSNKDLIEKYGNPRLVWGYYPLSADYNNGGCVGGCGESPLPTSFDAARGAASKKAMVERGGNNALHFRQTPGYTQHVVGTGCYNSNCHSPNCHGDSLCHADGSPLSLSPRDPINAVSGAVNGMMNQGMEDAFSWLGMIALVYFGYNLFIKRR